jgi:DNA mismatch endonuclease, patch repair protein
MSDTHTPEQRKRNMQAIKSRSKLEDRVCKELWKKGIRYRKNVKKLKGTPDLAIQKHKVVIFIDSCFFHCCPLHGNMPKNNREYWERKLNRNIERDVEISKWYIEKNWNILRVWEHEIKEDFLLTVDKLITFIEESKKSNHKEKKH